MRWLQHHNAYRSRHALTALATCLHDDMSHVVALPASCQHAQLSGRLVGLHAQVVQVLTPHEMLQAA